MLLVIHDTDYRTITTKQEKRQHVKSMDAYVDGRGKISVLNKPQLFISCLSQFGCMFTYSAAPPTSGLKQIRECVS